jgi:hypothetical protein
MDIVVAKPKTVEAWQRNQRQMRLQIEQLGLPEKQKRNAHLMAMLETASAKIDRFGWSSMDGNVKDMLCIDWCDVLGRYMLDEVKDGIKAFFVSNQGSARSINEHQVERHIKAAHKRTLGALPYSAMIQGPGIARDLSETELEERRLEAEKIMQPFRKKVKS